MSRVLILFLLAASLPTTSFGQNKANRKDEQRENKRVNEAKQQLQKAQREWTSAVKEYRQQEAEVRQTEAKLRSLQAAYDQAREVAEEQLTESSGLPEAIRKMRSIRDDIAKLSKPLLDQLHKTEKWQSMNKKAKAAKAERETLIEDTERSDADIQAQLAKLDEMILAPEALENETLEADAKIKSLKGDYHESLNAIAQLRQGIDVSKIDSNPKVQSAKASMNAAQKDIAASLKELAELTNQLAKQRMAVVKANGSLQQAQQADQNDRNQSKPKGKK